MTCYHRVLAYGTLCRRTYPGRMELIAPGAVLVGPASTRASWCLDDLADGAFPGIRWPRTRAELALAAPVTGELWLVTRAGLRALDRHEGAPYLYERARAWITGDCARGAPWAWVYVSRREGGTPLAPVGGILQWEMRRARARSDRANTRARARAREQIDLFGARKAPAAEPGLRPARAGREEDGAMEKITYEVVREYLDGRQAILVDFAEVRELLGRPHDGSPADDRAIVEALVAAGAPEWVRDAEGFLDECWGLYGPPADGAED